MKKIVLPLACMIITASCNNKTESSTTDTVDPTITESRTDRLRDASADMETKKEELGNLTPYTSAQMSALVPKEIGGATASDIEISATMGTSLANANYKINDSTNIEISIIDCAGPAGAGIYNMQYLSMFGFEEEDEDEYTRTIDFNGGKAFENCKKTKPDCTLTFLSGGRFLVTLAGENVAIDQLKQFAKSIRLN